MNSELAEVTRTMDKIMAATFVRPYHIPSPPVRQNMYDLYICERCGAEEPGRSFLVTGTEYNYYSKICKSCRDADRREHYIKYPHRTKVSHAKKRCKDKGLPFDIDEAFLEQLIAEQNNLCYYSGIAMDPAGSKTNYVASLDRVDSTKGYTRDNVVFCCDIVNTMKSNLPLDEFYSIIEKILSHRDHSEESA